METTRIDLEPALIAAVRATVPIADLSAFYDTAYTKVTYAVGREGWRIAGPAIGWYHDAPTDAVDLTAGFVIEGAERGAESDDVRVVEMPGGAALVLTHVGPYDRLPEAWDRLEVERAELGVDGRGDFWEEYVTDPSPGGDPDANITRLVLPLRADA